MRTRDTSATERPSPRIAAVLALEEPSLAAVAGYLADPDAGVRRIAVATLDEHLPDGYHSALVDALSYADPGVRRETAEAVRELVEVLSLSRWADSEAAARHALTDALADGDADVRAYARHALSRVG